DAALHGMADGARLLVDLLEHEMLEAALFGHDGVPRDPLNRRLNRIPVEIRDAHGVFCEDRDLAIAQEKDVARVLQNRRNIRSDKKLAVSETNHHWRTFKNCNNCVWLVSVNDYMREDVA